MSKESTTTGGAPVDSGTILLIDGNASSLKRSVEILTESGFEVETASSPDELSGVPADVVFVFASDTRSPKGLLKTTREKLAEADLPLVLVLPKRNETKVAGAHDVDAILTRPVAPRTLVALSRALSEVSRLRRRLAARERQLEQALQEGGRVDPRTGFYSFESFKPLLAAEVKRARRYKYPFSIAIASLDEIEEIRERHGAETAELLEGGLRLAISRSLRDLDLPVAYGKGQVMVLMPHTPRKGARVMTDRMRRRVARTKLEAEGTRVGTSISVGIAAYEGDGDVSFGSLAQEAAAALKIAVERGGNRVAEVPITRRRGIRPPSEGNRGSR